MRFVAQVEPVGMMTSPIRKRERADGNRQRLERRGRTLARRFTSQDARDVNLQREGDNRVSTAWLEDADAQLFAWNNRNGAPHTERRRCHRSRARSSTGVHEHQQQASRHAAHAFRPRKSATPSHIFGRLAIS